MTTYELSSRAARRAYELARLRRSFVRATWLASFLGLAATITVDIKAALWLPIFFVVWTVLEWRGGALLRGGRIGALFGALVALVPTSLFMSCCRLGCSVGSLCCNMSRACAGVGMLLGFGAAALLSRLPGKDHTRATLGAGLGIVATAVPRCAGLMLGEGVGLLFGLAAGTAAAGLVCRSLGRRRQPA